MGQLIPGGLCGIVNTEPGNTQIGPYYPIVCPKCKDEHDAELGMKFGKHDNMGSSQEHHGEAITEIEFPMHCEVCASQYAVHIKTIVTGPVIYITEKKRGQHGIQVEI